MRICMLGWEFPPFISGGLGTACYGLTRALSDHGHEITFVLPRPVEEAHASHVRLLSPSAPARPQPRAASPAPSAPASPPNPAPAEASSPPPPTRPVVSEVDARVGRVDEAAAREAIGRLTILGIPGEAPSVYGEFTQPVPGEAEAVRWIRGEGPPPAPPAAVTREEEPAPSGERAEIVTALEAAGIDPAAATAAAETLTRGGEDYSGDVTDTAGRYAAMVLQMCRHEPFDVIHAHDWMTYPAGLALARATGRPLVAHIHSTEFDRSGMHVNQAIYDIERRGMQGATRVIAVSYLTRSTVISRYGVEPDRVKVVYNGVEWSDAPAGLETVRPKDKIVLFLGRITMQKGPEYFIAAARRVLEKMDNVKFLVAGSGDMARRMIELAAESGIGHKVLFTGFLRGRDVQRAFRMADCYVMPSVSEPFGIAPLEAMSHDTPVIISKQSGVSEVLRHALKVDFWDTDEMANKILAVLRHPPLSQTLREHGAFEVRRLTWDGAAEKCVKIYQEAAGA